MKTKVKYIIYVVVALVVGVTIGLVVNSKQPPQAKQNTETLAKVQKWTCSMHPQIIQSHPGKCPICGMELIPLTESHAKTADNAIKLSPYAQKLAEVETTKVERKYVTGELSLVGKLEYAETSYARISAHFPGRVEKLWADYTGMRVKRGEHLAELFSADLVVLQRELILMKSTLDNAKASGNPQRIKSAERDLNSTKNKMRIWGLTPDQISRLEKNTKPDENLTLYAPFAGVIIDKNIVEGQYFKTGDKLLTVANDSILWLKMEVYESDLELLRYGQQVTFTVEAYPGQTFRGQLVYIDREINSMTRTIMVRADVDNPTEQLKSGMFAKAKVQYKLGEKGIVLPQSLKGKWVSPMHPEIIKDHPGKCDICGMQLIPAESLGYFTSSAKNNSPALVIPASAPLITGKRAVVYIDKGHGKYEVRNIVLGHRAGNNYIVKSGLKAGERVVTRGNFIIDSAMQIAGKPGMMQPKKADDMKNMKSMSMHHKMMNNKLTAKQKKALQPIIDSYYKIQQALSSDNLPGTVKAALELAKNMDKTEDSGKPQKLLQKLLSQAGLECAGIIKAKTLKGARKSFAGMSKVVYELMKKYGVGRKNTAYRFYCPMAFDNKGEYWLQNTSQLANPYFGAMMLKCGELRETLKPQTKKGQP